MPSIHANVVNGTPQFGNRKSLAKRLPYGPLDAGHSWHTRGSIHFWAQRTETTESQRTAKHVEDDAPRQAMHLRETFWNGATKALEAPSAGGG
jgi:hypothetical protein